MSTQPLDGKAAGLFSDLRLVVPARVVGVGRGAAWVGHGWTLFTAAPLMWVISIVFMIGFMIASNFVPIIGGVVFNVLAPVFAAGFISACRSLETGGEFEIEHLLAGFTGQFGKLCVLGIAMTLAMFLLLVAFGLFAGLTVLGAVVTGDIEVLRSSLDVHKLLLLSLGLLVMLLFMIPVMAAYWFAPALVHAHGLGPIEAMKQSLLGCVRDFVPMLLWGLITFVLMIVAMIPLGLGILVWWPLMITSTYAAYRDMFTDDAPRTIPVPPFAATPFDPAA